MTDHQDRQDGGNIGTGDRELARARLSEEGTSGRGMCRLSRGDTRSDLGLVIRTVFGPARGTTECQRQVAAATDEPTKLRVVWRGAPKLAVTA